MSYAWQMKKDGKADATITTAVARLKRLSKLCNIEEPEQVKTMLATLEWKNATKRHVAQIYRYYLRYINKTWNEPKYTQESRIPFIPTETEIDNLISAGYAVLSPKL
jgi:hypothetical protein